ncbi:MAG: preprotein translocase subunit SecY, partial [Acidiferrobacterales bacterium]
MAGGPAAKAGNVGASGKLTELRKRIFFLLGALIVFRIGAYVPIPGVNAFALAALFEGTQNSIIGMFNMFGGGALERMSIFALGVMPYISASIIMQLMTAVVPSFEQLKKEGEAGRRKITQYTRYGTVILATVQAGAIASGLQAQSAGGMSIVSLPGMGFVITTIVTLVTGTMFLMWLGEQVTERGIGNGISMIIFAGIVSGLPGAIATTLDLTSRGTFQPLFVLLLFLIVAAVTGFVVFVERGQRRITVNYAKRQQGR